MATTAVLLSGCSDYTIDNAGTPRTTTSSESAADVRLLGVEEGAECDAGVISLVPYDFHLKLKIHENDASRFTFDLEMKDGTVQTGPSATSNGIVDTGKPTTSVDRVIVHAQDGPGTGESCVITLDLAI
ncbi:MAG: hypothetical protein GX610_01480 [Rhodococcus sp.]|nr:hypothetical protein [Rhodococcus sp. (in: high G+C Gram-positive bacteria)]